MVSKGDLLAALRDAIAALVEEGGSRPPPPPAAGGGGGGRAGGGGPTGGARASLAPPSPLLASTGDRPHAESDGSCAGIAPPAAAVPAGAAASLLASGRGIAPAATGTAAHGAGLTTIAEALTPDSPAGVGVAMAVEACLVHGLRAVASSNCGLWDAVTLLEGEAAPAVVAVVAAGRVTTALARVRAWIRASLNSHTLVPSVARLASAGAAAHRAAFFTEDALLRDPDAIARLLKLLEATQGLPFALRVDDARLERTGNTTSGATRAAAAADATGVAADSAAGAAAAAGSASSNSGGAGIEEAVERSMLEAVTSPALAAEHCSSTTAFHRHRPSPAPPAPDAPPPPPPPRGEPPLGSPPLGSPPPPTPTHTAARAPGAPQSPAVPGAPVAPPAALQPLRLPAPTPAATTGPAHAPPSVPPSTRSRAGSSVAGAAGDLTTPPPTRTRGLSLALLGSGSLMGAPSARGTGASSSLFGSIMSTASGWLERIVPTLSTLTAGDPATTAGSSSSNASSSNSSSVAVDAGASGGSRGHDRPAVHYFHVPLAAAVLDPRQCTHALLDARLSVPEVVHRIRAWLMAAPDEITRGDGAGMGSVSMQLDAVRALAARFDATGSLEGGVPPPGAAVGEDCHLVANLLTFFCLALPQAPIPPARWETLLACGDLPHAETHHAAIDGAAAGGSGAGSGGGGGGDLAAASPRLRNLRLLLSALPVEHRALLAEVLPLYAWMAGVRYTDDGSPVLDAGVLLSVQVLADVVGTALARPPGIVGAMPAPPLAAGGGGGGGSGGGSSIVMATSVNQLCSGVTARMASADVERLGRVVATLLLHWRWVLADVLAERERYHDQLVAAMHGMADCHDALVTAVTMRDARHQLLLRRLWEASVPAIAVSTAVDTADFTADAAGLWRAIGFEHAAPATDLANICLEPRQPPGPPRGSGLLGLQTLVYFAERYNERWSRMLASLHGVTLRTRGGSVSEATEPSGGYSGGSVAGRRPPPLRHAASAPEADGGGRARPGASGGSVGELGLVVVDASGEVESGEESEGDAGSAPPSPIAAVSWYPLASAALVTVRRLAEACYLAGVRTAARHAVGTAASPDALPPTPADAPSGDAFVPTPTPTPGAGAGDAGGSEAAAERAARARLFFSPILVAHGVPDLWTLGRVAAGQAVGMRGSHAAASSGLALEVAPSEAFLALAGVALCILHERWAAGGGILRDLPAMVDDTVADAMALLPDLVADAMACGARGYLEAPPSAEPASSGSGGGGSLEASRAGPFDVVTALGRWRRRAELAGTLPPPGSRAALPASRSRAGSATARGGGGGGGVLALGPAPPAAGVAGGEGHRAASPTHATRDSSAAGGGGGSVRKSARAKALLASAMSPGGTTLHTVDPSVLRLLPPSLLPVAALAEGSGILSAHQAGLLEAVLPRAIRGYEWVKVYALTRHGAVLDTLVSRAREHGSTLLVMRDDAGTVFGGYVSEPWAPPRRGGFYGNGQAFVFTFADRRGFDAERAEELEAAAREEGDAIRFALHAVHDTGGGGGGGGGGAGGVVHAPHAAPPRPEATPTPSPEADGAAAAHPHFSVYRWSRRNKYFQMCTSDGIGMGGGGHFAWYLDADLCSGNTGRSETFLSPPLAHAERFTVLELEVWGFHRRLHFHPAAAAAAAPSSSSS